MSSSDDSIARESVKRTYSPTDPDQPLLAIVKAVSELKDQTSRELSPLQRAIDLEALTELLGERAEGHHHPPQRPTAEILVRFRYEECEVKVGRTVVRAQTI